MEIILASASPRRQELLKMVTEHFSVCPAAIDESRLPQQTPSEYVQTMAAQKAHAVAVAHPQGLVIGCDTIVTVDEDIYGKPENEEEAARMLRTFSGKPHIVMTAVCLCGNNRLEEFTQQASVCFYPLTDKDIAWYVGTKEWTDKAGGYGIQGKGALLVKEIHGDYYTVVGLPVALLSRKINKFLRND